MKQRHGMWLVMLAIVVFLIVWGLSLCSMGVEVA